jgi:CRP/FNR family transcriptional regulator, cyclic AMP receptor protein
VPKPVQLLPLPEARRVDDARLWTNVLADVPLFAGLNRRHLRKVAGLGKIRRFHEGATIMRAGEPGDAMYVILDGKVSVRPPGKRNVAVGIGGFVGELSLLDDGPRSATVVASEPSVTLCITRASFCKLMRTEPSMALAVSEELARRLRS